MPEDHTINIAPEYFQHICSGTKTVEGRIAKEKYCAMQPGDTLVFVSDDARIATEIVNVQRFTSFQQMLQHCGLHNCLPHIHSVEEGIALYRAFPGYALAEKTEGVIGIHIRLKSDKRE